MKTLWQRRTVASVGGAYVLLKTFLLASLLWRGRGWLAGHYVMLVSFVLDPLIVGAMMNPGLSRMSTFLLLGSTWMVMATFFWELGFHVSVVAWMLVWASLVRLLSNARVYAVALTCTAALILVVSFRHVKGGQLISTESVDGGIYGIMAALVAAGFVGHFFRDRKSCRD